MKKVFTNSGDVIHLFAQQSQSDARANNVFFETPYNSKKEYGTHLYSYGHHYLLAEFIDDNTVVINDDGYSVTTLKHIGQVSRGLSQYKRFFKSQTDLNTVYCSVIANKEKLANARKPEIYINNILSLWSSLNEFLEHTKAKKYKSNPKYKEIKKIVSSLENNTEEYKIKLKELAVKKAKSDKLRAKKELKEKLSKFMNYEINSFRINGVNDHLRISQDNKRVETSQGVKIPIKSAVLLYKLIKAGKDIKGYQIENYTVISINGVLKIGCHNIDRKNVSEIGEKLLKLKF